MINLTHYATLAAPAIAQALQRATIGAARDEEYDEKLIPLGFTAISDDTPEGFTEFVRSQDRVWRDLVEISGAKLD
ncbi:MAG: hypothetical protein ACKO54_08970 [Alphaproteobacteria bacterium]